MSVLYTFPAPQAQAGTPVFKPPAPHSVSGHHQKSPPLRAGFWL